MLLMWTGALALGFYVMLRHEFNALSPMPSAGTAPSALLDDRSISMTVAIHPHCPCSKASVEEISKICGLIPTPPKMTVLAFKPGGEADAWTQTPILAKLEALGANIVVDTDGKAARELGMNVSGQVRLHSPRGDLVYSGGVTGSRGHVGDNTGKKAVLGHLRGAHSEVRSAPAFGCSLFEIGK